VVLAALGEGGSIDEVPVERVEAAVAAIAAQRSTDGPYDVAVTLPARPDDDRLATYQAAGATWIMVTGWIDQLDELVGQLD
jgi:hypothetical protein